MVRFRYDNQPSLDRNRRNDTTSFSGSSKRATPSNETSSSRSSSKKKSDGGAGRDRSGSNSYNVGFLESIKAVFPWTEEGAKVSRGGQIHRSVTIQLEKLECMHYTDGSVATAVLIISLDFFSLCDHELDFLVSIV